MLFSKGQGYNDTQCNSVTFSWYALTNSSTELNSSRVSPRVLTYACSNVFKHKSNSLKFNASQLAILISLQPISFNNGTCSSLNTLDKKLILCEGEGNGPVHALDNPIKNNVDKLAKYSQYLKDLKLVDYKVRILNTGTEAVTRVSIESTDSKGKNWFTIGVSPNIIDASFKALVDSLDYKLFKDKAPASI